MTTKMHRGLRQRQKRFTQHGDQYITFAGQMEIYKMPGDHLRYAALSLRRVRREWNAMQFFDRMTCNEGFPAHADIINGREREFGQH